MITIGTQEFEDRLQCYVFVRHGIEINPATNLPDSPCDWCCLDVDDLYRKDFPEHFKLHAIVESNEELGWLRTLKSPFSSWATQEKDP